MSTSLFDFLQPSEDPGGLSGLALALQGQGGQPRGLKQGLGAGLLSASGMAQEALPQAIQGGFGPGLLTGFLGSLGAPARQAVSQEEEKAKVRRQVQLSFLQDAFPKLSSGSKQEVLKRLGVDLGGLQFQEAQSEPSLVTKELIGAYIKILGDKEQPKETRQDAWDTLVSLDPEAGKAFKGLRFFDDSPEGVRATANDLFDNFTTNSVQAFLDPTDPNHGVFSKLVSKPPEEKGGAGGKVDKLALQAVSDRGQIEALAQSRGITVDQATEIFFQGDKARRSSYEKEWGMTAGSTPPSEQEQILRVADMLAKAGILKDVGQTIPAAVSVLQASEAEAKKLAEQHGSIAVPGEKAGARNPAGIAAPLPPGTAPFAAPPTVFGGVAAPPAAAPAPAFPGPVAPPTPQPTLAPQTTPVPPALTKGLVGKEATQTDALYRAAVASGIDLKGVKNKTELMAKLKTLPVDQRVAILQAAKSMIPGGGLSD